MKKKIQVYHFHNGSGGGVLSVIRNLVRFSNNPSLENHVIYTINKDETPLYIFKRLEGAQSEQVFYYSPKWNFYHTCSQLAKLLPDDKALVVAHDWIELGMVSNLGLQNKVIQILHGDYEYYYSLAKSHTASVDAYVTVTSSIKDKLQAMIPGKSEDIHYLRFPVPESHCTDSPGRELNSIIFIGRSKEEKGYHLLPVIARSLLQKQINLQWNIVGTVNEKDKDLWGQSVNVIFHGSMSNDAVCALLCKMQYFILPSIAEGMPVSLIESMKAGVIPIINDIPGGVQELIKNKETGYLLKNNSVNEYVEILELIINDDSNIKLMRENCKRKAGLLFNPFQNTKQYENLFLQVAAKDISNKHAVKVYGSRLDHPLIPNIISSSIREFK